MLENSEIVFTTSLHPRKNEFNVEFPADQPGKHIIQIIIEGAAPGELKKLQKGEIDRPKEEERANETWEIMVAEEEELYQSEYDLAKQIVHDTLALYAAGSISFSICKRLWNILEELPEEDREEITTLSDFENLGSSEDSDE